MIKIYTALAVFALGLHAGMAQEAKDVKIKGEKLQITSIQTPQFQASNVPEKKWRPKDWMEVTLPFEVNLSNEAGGRKGSLASMNVVYYIGLSSMSSDNKPVVIRGMFNYADIPAAEKSFALAYVAPPTLRRLLQKDTFNASSDVKAWGYEILVNAQLVAGESSTPGKWWEAAEKLSISDGALLSKDETPFNILWGDYDVKAKKQ